MKSPRVAFETLYAAPSRNGVYKSAEYRGHGIPMVNMGELFGCEFIGSQEMERIELSTVELERSGLKDGDLLFGRRSIVEAGAGKCALVVDPPDALTFESSIIRVRLQREKANPRYFHYYFSSPQGRGLVRTIVSGAAVKGIRGSALSKLEVPVPGIETQNRVAALLQAYDDLIENNRRRIVLLEDAARQLYREWFVRLRFPGREHTRINSGVPDGWRRRRLDEVCVINAESIRSSYDGEIEYIDISSVTPGSVNETLRCDFRDAPSRARRVVKHGDIIWSCVRPNRKSYAVIWQPSSNTIVSTGFAVLTPTAVPTTYLLQATTTDAFVGYLENHARGAAYPAVVSGDFERAELLVPRASLLAMFNELAEPLLAQANTLRLQIEKLRTARDLLLPRLMSGQVTV